LLHRRRSCGVLPHRPHATRLGVVVQTFLRTRTFIAQRDISVFRKIDELIDDGTISGGMIPKIEGAIDAAKSGVNAVHIVDGRVPHAMLLEILTDQAYGTMIRSH
ncbi:MAG: hypothetical protein ACK4TS_03205, partial [Aquabacterium sp.]